jgi:hypothetical protein
MLEIHERYAVTLPTATMEMTIAETTLLSIKVVKGGTLAVIYF